jgi:hypothetical protein
MAPPVVTVRPGNNFGLRQSSRAIVPTIMGQLRGEACLRLGSFERVRDLNSSEKMRPGFIGLRATGNHDNLVENTVSGFIHRPGRRGWSGGS